jgi:predicted Zn finger-like uncharacterized protein
MQVICPSCGARYAVDPSAIGPIGRTVQCARCHHRWLETIEDATVAALPPRPAGRPAPDFVFRPQPHSGAQLPAVTKPRAHARWGRWITAAVVLLAATAAAFVYRDEIASQLPSQWHTILSFHAARAAVPDPPQLEVDMAASQVELVDGHYVVSGELVNWGGQEGSTTSLRLVFRKGEDVLGERVYSLVEGPIAPGGRLSFSWPLDDPPEGTTNIVPIVE